MAMISVIIPIYNTEPYLPACLDSVCAQTESNMEILAVNNGCTDRCPTILQTYAQKDPRIHVISIPHGQIADARNAALQQARGKYIAFCDSDDTLPSHAYRSLLKTAEKYCSDVVVGEYYEITSHGSMQKVSLPLHPESGVTGLLDTPCLWNKLIRREFIEKYDLSFRNVSVGEDFLFLAEILKFDPVISYLKHPIYCYWLHERPSISRKYTLDLFKGHLECRTAFLHEMEDSRYSQAARNHVFLKMTPYLKNFLFCLWTVEDRESAFALLQEHLSAFDWKPFEDTFFKIFGVPIQQFLEISAQDYMIASKNLDHREAVLSEFQAGSIGFRYIAAYIRAWASAKLANIKHHKREGAL